MRYKAIKALEGVQEVEFHFYPDRAKSEGRMWGGSAVLTRGDVTFDFMMWAHLRDDGVMREEAEDHMSLRGVDVDGKYHDLHWSSIMTEDSIYIHPKGWFNNYNLEGEVREVLHGRKNYNFERDTLTPEQVKQLLQLGFYKLI